MLELCPDLDMGFQGSSVTGAPFDEGRVSDYDIAVSGDSVNRAAHENGHQVVLFRGEIFVVPLESSTGPRHAGRCPRGSSFAVTPDRLRPASSAAHRGLRLGVDWLLCMPRPGIAR
jgi:hypothetical protein